MERAIIKTLRRLSASLPPEFQKKVARRIAAGSFRSFARAQEFDAAHVSEDARSVISFLEQEGIATRVTCYGDTKDVPLCYAGAGFEHGDLVVSGIGVSRTYGKALFAALTELLERYALAACDKHILVRRAPTSWEQEVFGMRSGDALAWVRGHALTGEEVFLPAQMVFSAYDVEAATESALCEPNTSGAAGALSKENALAFGIYEAVERDAFLSHWLKRVTPPQADIGCVTDEEIGFLTECARKNGLRVHLLDITSDLGIPVYMAVLLRDTVPMVSRGFSANLDPNVAIKKALYEAWGNYMFNAYLAGQDENAGGEGANVERPILARYKLWLKTDSFPHLEFLLRGGRVPVRRPSFAAAHELEVLTRLFRERDYDVVYYCADDPVLKALDFHAVKVVIPKLIPFYFREEHGHFAHTHRRLRGGIKNTFPHPFA